MGFSSYCHLINCCGFYLIFYPTEWNSRRLPYTRNSVVMHTQCPKLQALDYSFLQVQVVICNKYQTLGTKMLLNQKPSFRSTTTKLVVVPDLRGSKRHHFVLKHFS
jgi:hypothetical protein